MAGALACVSADWLRAVVMRRCCGSGARCKGAQLSTFISACKQKQPTVATEKTSQRMVLDGFGCSGKSLGAAAARGNVEAVRRMLQDQRVEPDALNEFGKTALQVMMMGCTSVASVLLDHGADPNVQDRCGVTPAHDAARTGFLDTLRVLVEYGASVNVPDHSGALPIHVAIREGHCDVVEYLAPLSNLGHRDGRGASALDAARDARAAEMVELLERLMETGSS